MAPNMRLSTVALTYKHNLVQITGMRDVPEFVGQHAKDLLQDVEEVGKQANKPVKADASPALSNLPLDAHVATSGTAQACTASITPFPARLDPQSLAGARVHRFHAMVAIPPQLPF